VGLNTIQSESGEPAEEAMADIARTNEYAGHQELCEKIYPIFFGKQGESVVVKEAATI
jgi:hypothetical protein